MIMKKTDPKTFPFKCIIWAFVELLAAFLTDLSKTFNCLPRNFIIARLNAHGITWHVMGY